MTKAPRRREKGRGAGIDIWKEGLSVHRHHRVSEKRDLQQPQDYDHKPPDSLSLSRMSQELAKAQDQNKTLSAQLAQANSSLADLKGHIEVTEQKVGQEK